MMRQLLCRVFGHVWRCGGTWRECRRCGKNQSRQGAAEDPNARWVTISYLGPPGKLW